MKMKHSVAASLGMALCVLSGVFLGQSTRTLAQTEPSTTQPTIEQLFRDRYDVADRGYTLSMIGHLPGQALGNETMNWLRLRANARRGLRESNAQRIAFVKDYLHQLQEQEAFEERLKQQNLVDADTVLFARYERIEAEIWLAQEEQN